MKVATVFLLCIFLKNSISQQIVREPVPDSEITALGETLWKLDVNNVFNQIKVDVQDAVGRDGKDHAPKPLLEVPESVYRKPTISKLLTLYDNYIPAINTTEVLTPQESVEESAFLDAILETQVMKKAEEFLIKHRFIINRKTDRNGKVIIDPKAFRNAIYQIWFTFFARENNVKASSGFEHVFLGETKRDEVVGFHNWIFFSKQEANRSLNYFGHRRIIRLGNKGMIIKNNFKWNGLTKPVTSMFVGTSPEFEFALYTVCYYARPGGKCPITIAGKTVPITSYFVNRQGKRYLSSAFPDV